jgi:hypothetical protein
MELRVSSPCPRSWEDLIGNDRIRYCDQCKLNVYNLAELESQEVEGLVRRTEGRLCGRLYWRGDRTATPRDCPWPAKQRGFRRIVATGSALFLVLFASVFRNMEGPDRGSFPGWLRELVELIDPQPVQRRPAVLGWLRPVPPPVSPAAQPGPTRATETASWN